MKQRPEPDLRLGRRLRQRRLRRHHRVEKRQRHRDADAAEERAPREVLLEHGAHRVSLLDVVSFIWNGTLRTTPRTIDEKR